VGVLAPGAFAGGTASPTGEAGEGWRSERSARRLCKYPTGMGICLRVQLTRSGDLGYAVNELQGVSFG